MEPIGFVLENVTLVGAGPPRRVSIFTHFDRIGGVYEEYPENHIPMGSYAYCDLTGRFVSAGLIDSHLHLSRVSSENIDAHLDALVRGGVMTIRDMGGDATLLRRLSQSEMNNPRILFSSVVVGPHLAETASAEIGALQVAANTDLDVLLDAARASGASGLSVRGGIDAMLLRRLGIAALDLPPTLQGPVPDRAVLLDMRPPPNPMPLWWEGGAAGPAAPSDVIRAGVRVYSHAESLSFEAMRGAGAEFWNLPYDERIRRAMRTAPVNGRLIGNVIAQLRQRDVILEPTLFRLASAVETAREQGAADLPLREAELQYAAAVTRRAHRAGVRIAAGTDAIGSDSPALHSELYLLVSLAGLTPQEALVAATQTNADVLSGRGGAPTRGLGQIAPATLADIVIYDRDPTSDIRNTQSIVAVVRAGRLMIREEPMAPAPLTGN